MTCETKAESVDAFTVKTSKFDKVPPWGDRPPARPLSPKRRPKVAAAVSAQKQKAVADRYAFVLPGVVLLGVVTTLYWVYSAPASVSHSVADRAHVVPARPSVARNAVDGDGLALSYLHKPSKDVFILDDISDPTQLENHTKAASRLSPDVFVHFRGHSERSAPIAAASIFVNTIKLEEVGTSWSAPHRAATGTNSPSAVTFRDAADAAEKQDAKNSEKAWTYKLQWFGEQPLIYKLQWFEGPDDRPATYKLQWFTQSVLGDRSA